MGTATFTPPKITHPTPLRSGTSQAGQIVPFVHEMASDDIATPQPGRMHPSMVILPPPPWSRKRRRKVTRGIARTRWNAARSHPSKSGEVRGVSCQSINYRRCLSLATFNPRLLALGMRPKSNLVAGRGTEVTLERGPPPVRGLHNLIFRFPQAWSGRCAVPSLSASIHHKWDSGKTS